MVIVVILRRFTRVVILYVAKNTKVADYLIRVVAKPSRNRLLFFVSVLNNIGVCETMVAAQTISRAGESESFEGGGAFVIDGCSK
jgi:hypothetical protein